MASELERVEWRLVQVIKLLERITARQEEILELLSPPTYPASIGGTITVK